MDSVNVDNNIEVIITVTEETAINVSVRTDVELSDKYTTIKIEPWECTKMSNNAWVRESLLFDIENVVKRCDVAECIIQLYKVVAEMSDIVQIHLLNNKVDVKRVNNIRDITNIPYDDMSTDASHIGKNIGFFSTSKINGITEQNGNDSMNLINTESHFCFVGNNGDMSQDGHVCHYVMTIEDFEALVDDKDPKNIPMMVLVVNPEYCEIGSTIIDKYYQIIECVICDTYKIDCRMACMFLSIAKNRGVLTCRALAISDTYFFGNENFGPGNNNSQVGLINMSDELLTRDYNYLIVLDPRMAQIRDFVIILNKRAHISIILIKHTINDDDLRDIGNYNVFPEFQTQQLSQIDQLSRGHVLHTVTAVHSVIPGIAEMMIDCGIFTSCHEEVVLEYMENVLTVLNHVIIEEVDSDDIIEMIEKKLQRIAIKDTMQKVLEKIVN